MPISPSRFRPFRYGGDRWGRHGAEEEGVDSISHHIDRLNPVNPIGAAFSSLARSCD